MYSHLATPSKTRAVLEQFGLATKHRLGQNFLVNDAIIQKIVELAALQQDDVVLEVGPGIGTLTCALLPRVKGVVSIEADKDLEEVLTQTLLANYDSFRLILADALKVTPEQLSEVTKTLGCAGPNAFVANLPYQVAATLILQYLQCIPTLRCMCVMVQAEVADRISACPNNKMYGAYTAKLHLYGKVTGRFEVAPSNFMPPPHVNSSVIRIEKYPYVNAQNKELSRDELQWVSRVIDASFTQRRKTIRNCLRSTGFAAEALDTAFKEAGIAPGVRAEALSVDEFVSLAEALTHTNF